MAAGDVVRLDGLDAEDPQVDERAHLLGPRDRREPTHRAAGIVDHVADSADERGQRHEHPGRTEQQEVGSPEQRLKEERDQLGIEIGEAQRLFRMPGQVSGIETVAPSRAAAG